MEHLFAAMISWPASGEGTAIPGEVKKLFFIALVERLN
jgi:hypothetical protein